MVKHIRYNDTILGGVCVVCDAMFAKWSNTWVRRRKVEPTCPGVRPTKEEDIYCYGRVLPEQAYNYSWRGIQRGFKPGPTEHSWDGYNCTYCGISKCDDHDGYYCEQWLARLRKEASD